MKKPRRCNSAEAEAEALCRMIGCRMATRMATPRAQHDLARIPQADGQPVEAAAAAVAAS